MENKYTKDEVHQATLEYFDGDELATNVWTSKYALRDLEDNYYEKTPDDMHRRLSKEFARIETKYPESMSEDEIYKLEGYFQRKYTKLILDQINNFEFPDDWTPKQVIDYITYKIDKNRFNF